jgi:hypothetical protein
MLSGNCALGIVKREWVEALSGLALDFMHACSDDPSSVQLDCSYRDMLLWLVVMGRRYMAVSELL